MSGMIPSGGASSSANQLDGMMDQMSPSDDKNKEKKEPWQQMMDDMNDMVQQFNGMLTDTVTGALSSLTGDNSFDKMASSFNLSQSNGSSFGNDATADASLESTAGMAAGMI
ncbi:hypothetical protein [Legionella genomosp. 1]|uniref:hypothetical protein n=1 Tax=Legionella genomosp. 1 TaxID=1093625 RepID=UPI001054C603|nr:hypothetical protein [Legionella genomosp. 1]